MDPEIVRLVAVFIAGAFGAVIGPFVKSLFDKKTDKKSAKLQNRPEVYEELIYFLIHGKCSEQTNLSALKAKILTYSKDDVIKHIIEYLKIKDSQDENLVNLQRHKTINYIRDQLEMGTDFDHKEIAILLKM